MAFTFSLSDNCKMYVYFIYAYVKTGKRKKYNRFVLNSGFHNLTRFLLLSVVLQSV